MTTTSNNSQTSQAQTTTNPAHVIAIVGAGFSGVAVATRLLTTHNHANLKIILINASGKRARGVAYGTESPNHVLNVPAGRMSIWDEKPDDFLQFLALTQPTIRSHDFVPRSLYGDYLEHTLHTAQQHSPHTLAHHVGCVIDIKAQPDATHQLIFADGSRLLANKVVLALGNFLPQNPPLSLMSAAAETAIFNHPAYLRDPWSAQSQAALQALPHNARILLLGTGLSMLDVAVLLNSDVHQHVTIDAISRRGLLPQAHREAIAGSQSKPFYAYFNEQKMQDMLHPLRALANTSAGDVTARQPTVLAMLRALRQVIAAHAPNDWRDVIAAMRSFTPALWQALPNTEQQRFIRHLAPYWDTHRHRAAPQPAQAFLSAIANSKISPKAARIAALHDSGGQLLATIKNRGASNFYTQQYHLVINCTGPHNCLHNVDAPLIAALLRSGAATTLSSGAGFALTENLCLNAAGLYYVGPLLRANFWEATAVPELRAHAKTVAFAILQALR